MRAKETGCFRTASIMTELHDPLFNKPYMLTWRSAEEPGPSAIKWRIRGKLSSLVLGVHPQLRFRSSPC